MAWNQDQTNYCNQGYLKNPNPKSIGISGGDDEIKAKGGHQLKGFSNSNLNNRFDVDESRLAKIKAKISVEDLDYLKGFAISNKGIDVDDPRLAKIRAKISQEDVDYLKGIANSNFNERFGANNTGPVKFFDNTGTISFCVFL